MVPVIPPPSNFLTPHKPGRNIRPSTRSSTKENPIHSHIKNNDRCFIVPNCNTEKLRRSFFPRTIVAWNNLQNSTVTSSSIESYKTALVVASRRWSPQPAVHSPPLHQMPDTLDDGSVIRIRIRMRILILEGKIQWKFPRVTVTVKSNEVNAQFLYFDDPIKTFNQNYQSMN